jgi:hypothetical protein
LIPERLLVTVPEPVPASVTDSRKLGITVNVAATETLAESVTVQGAVVPVQPPPDQPVKLDPAAAEAVRVTCVPEANIAAHSLLLALQSMPAGLLVTVPAPVPAGTIVSVKSGFTVWVSETALNSKFVSPL